MAISPNLCISFFFVSLFHPIFLSTYLFYLTLHPHVCRKQLCETSLPLWMEVDKTKRKKFCKAPSNSQGGQHQKRGISARLPSKMKSLVQSWRLQCNFSIPFVKNVAPTAKKWSQVILSAAPFSGNQHPDLQTCPMVYLVWRLLCKMCLCESFQPYPFCKGVESLTHATKNSIWASKSDPNMVLLKYVSRNNAVHFFDIGASKSGPKVLSTFWFWHVFCVTTPCTFSTA